MVAVVERLCSHHYISSFRCAEDPRFEQTLQSLYDDTGLGILSRTYVSLVEAWLPETPRLEVAGFVAAADVMLNLPALNRFLCVTHLAVSDHARDVVHPTLLLRKIRDLYDALVRIGKTYAGFAAIPGQNQLLIDTLESLGFERYQQSGFWIRSRYRS